MPKPGEHKTVQSRILTYTQEIGWTFVPREEAEARRGFNNHSGNIQEKAQQASLYFDALLYQKVCQFNPNYSEAEGVLIAQLSNLPTDIYGNRDFLTYLRNQGKYFYAAEILFKAPESDKPTILLMIDRNELEDQMLRNLNNLGLNNVQHADRITTLNNLLKNDYRGIIVTTIYKFRDLPAKINLRKNIYILIDEAHRTTGGDLGTFLMAGFPNATFVGFTGTPIDQTSYGKGTFKTFGTDDKQGYLLDTPRAEATGILLSQALS